MILLFGIDFLSAIITGTLLWTSCKINVFKVLKQLQKKLWLMMAMLEAYLFITVKIKYKNCMKIKGHSYFFCLIFLTILSQYIGGLFIARGDDLTLKYDWFYGKYALNETLQNTTII